MHVRPGSLSDRHIVGLGMDEHLPYSQYHASRRGEYDGHLINVKNHNMRVGRSSTFTCTYLDLNPPDSLLFSRKNSYRPFSRPIVEGGIRPTDISRVIS